MKTITTPKRGRGRPPTDPDTHQTVRLDLRVTPALDDALRTAAASAGVTLAEIARARLSGSGGEDGALTAAREAGRREGLEQARAALEALTAER